MTATFNAFTLPLHRVVVAARDFDGDFYMGAFSLMYDAEMRVHAQTGRMNRAPGLTGLEKRIAKEFPEATASARESAYMYIHDL